MAETRVKLRNLNIAPRKVRLVADAIKGLHVQEALAHLDSMPQRSTGPLAKLLKSAIANAKEQKMDENNLVINSIRVDKGIALKRAKARARGRATLVEKKMSHVILELEEKENAKSPEFRFQEKPRVDKKERKPKREEKPKLKKEELKQEKTKRGFRDRIFRRKSV
jgi:large subunit ribosomal protein L22